MSGSRLEAIATTAASSSTPIAAAPASQEPSTAQGSSRQLSSVARVRRIPWTKAYWLASIC